jgi:phage-related tail fiber protein
MAKTVVPNVAREKMAKARAGIRTLPPITHVAFGDGGVGSDGEVLTPSSAMTSLNHEILRKPIEGYNVKSQTVITYIGKILEGELGGKSCSEIATIDSEGDLAGVEFFKGKPDDLISTFEIDDDFT